MHHVAHPLTRLRGRLRTHATSGLAPVTVRDTALRVRTIISTLGSLIDHLADALSGRELFATSITRRLQAPLTKIHLRLRLLTGARRVSMTPLITQLSRVVRDISRLLRLTHTKRSFSSNGCRRMGLLRSIVLPSCSRLDAVLSRQRRALLLPRDTTSVAIRNSTALLQVLLQGLMRGTRHCDPRNDGVVVGLRRSNKTIVTIRSRKPNVSRDGYKRLDGTFMHVSDHCNKVNLKLDVIDHVARLRRKRFFLRGQRRASNAQT